jgi:ribokinase
MKILNFGSLNIDYVYGVEDLVRAGETINSRSFQKICGGKGLNQSIALSNAGAKVYHAGMIGQDGLFLKNMLDGKGVDTTLIRVLDQEASGHAIIQVDKNGQNSIILFSGANAKLDNHYIDSVLEQFSAGDVVLLQNETSSIPHIIEKARNMEMTVFFNPAPMNDGVLDYPLNNVNYFIINEIEGRGLSGQEDPEKMIDTVLKKYKESSVILTLGEKGCIFADNSQRMFIPAEKVDTVDTTAAGDTFIGYFIAEFVRREEIKACLQTAALAASVCVTRNGSADSIPMKQELKKYKL